MINTSEAAWIVWTYKKINKQNKIKYSFVRRLIRVPITHTWNVTMMMTTDVGVGAIFGAESFVRKVEEKLIRDHTGPGIIKWIFYVMVHRSIWGRLINRVGSVEIEGWMRVLERLIRFTDGMLALLLRLIRRWTVCVVVVLPGLFPRIDNTRRRRVHVKVIYIAAYVRLRAVRFARATETWIVGVRVGWMVRGQVKGGGGFRSI